MVAGFAAEKGTRAEALFVESLAKPAPDIVMLNPAERAAVTEKSSTAAEIQNIFCPVVVCMISRSIG